MRHQRHRTDGTLLVALLAVLLQDWGDVPRERDLTALLSQDVALE